VVRTLQGVSAPDSRDEDPSSRSRSLAPKYEKLAELYASNSDLSSKVTVAKIDATANDVPDEISGFPTIKLYPAGAKDSPVDYHGSRTVEDLADFIRDNGKYGADAFAAQDEDTDATSTAGETAAKAAPAATTVEEGVKGDETAEADTDDEAHEHDEL